MAIASISETRIGRVLRQVASGKRRSVLPTTGTMTAATAAAPAGGTGAAAGGWDTAGNRDIAIAQINNLRTRVIELELVLAKAGFITQS